MTAASEFSFIVKLDDIGQGASQYHIAANDAERAGLAARFDLISLDAMTADLLVSKTAKGILAKGNLTASAVQACIATGMPVPADISETMEILFILEPAEDGEYELDADECDSMFHDGRGVDIGEAAAQSLGLSLPPYPRSKGAQKALRKAGVKSEEEEKIENGPFAALAGLKDKMAK
jgi:uncharacterized metal-binding protein YceD (DUF177 family)